MVSKKEGECDEHFHSSVLAKGRRVTQPNTKTRTIPNAAHRSLERDHSQDGFVIMGIVASGLTLEPICR